MRLDVLCSSIGGRRRVVLEVKCNLRTTVETETGGDCIRPQWRPIINGYPCTPILFRTKRRFRLVERRTCESKRCLATRGIGQRMASSIIQSIGMLATRLPVACVYDTGIIIVDGGVGLNLPQDAIETNQPQPESFECFHGLECRGRGLKVWISRHVEVVVISIHPIQGNDRRTPMVSADLNPSRLPSILTSTLASGSLLPTKSCSVPDSISTVLRNNLERRHS